MEVFDFQKLIDTQPCGKAFWIGTNHQWECSTESGDGVDFLDGGHLRQNADTFIVPGKGFTQSYAWIKEQGLTVDDHRTPVGLKIKGTLHVFSLCGGPDFEGTQEDVEAAMRADHVRRGGTEPLFFFWWRDPRSGPEENFRLERGSERSFQNQQPNCIWWMEEYIVTVRP